MDHLLTIIEALRDRRKNAKAWYDEIKDKAPKDELDSRMKAIHELDAGISTIETILHSASGDLPAGKHPKVLVLSVHNPKNRLLLVDNTLTTASVDPNIP